MQSIPQDTARALLIACHQVEAIAAEMTRPGREAGFGLLLLEAVRGALAKAGDRFTEAPVLGKESGADCR